MKILTYAAVCWLTVTGLAFVFALLLKVAVVL